MVMLRDMNYDPSIHITAGQLRGLGFYLQELIPDEAFVRRIAVGPRGQERIDDGSPTVGLEVLEPFREIEAIDDELVCI